MSLFFTFIQFEFTHALGPHAARYVVEPRLVRDASVVRHNGSGGPPPAEPIDPELDARNREVAGVSRGVGGSDVLVVGVVGASAGRPRLLRRSRQIEPDEPVAEVPLSLLTYVRGTEPIETRAEAARRLDELRFSADAQQRWVDDGLRAVNLAIRAYRPGSRSVPHRGDAPRRAPRPGRLRGHGRRAEPVLNWLSSFRRPNRAHASRRPGAPADRQRPPALAPVRQARVPEAEDVLIRALVDLDQGARARRPNKRQAGSACCKASFARPSAGLDFESLMDSGRRVERLADVACARAPGAGRGAGARGRRSIASTESSPGGGLRVLSTRIGAWSRRASTATATNHTAATIASSSACAPPSHRALAVITTSTITATTGIGRSNAASASIAGGGPGTAGAATALAGESQRTGVRATDQLPYFLARAGRRAPGQPAPTRLPARPTDDVVREPPTTSMLWVAIRKAEPASRCRRAISAQSPLSRTGSTPSSKLSSTAKSGSATSALASATRSHPRRKARRQQFRGVGQADLVEPLPTAGAESVLIPPRSRTELVAQVVLHGHRVPQRRSVQPVALEQHTEAAAERQPSCLAHRERRAPLDEHVTLVRDHVDDVAQAGRLPERPRVRSGP